MTRRGPRDREPRPNGEERPTRKRRAAMTKEQMANWNMIRAEDADAILMQQCTGWIVGDLPWQHPSIKDRQIWLATIGLDWDARWNVKYDTIPQQ